MNPIGLLVSVRSADEAVRAVDGGASIIDVKEPTLGSLGRAEDHVIRAVIDAVAGARPVSAALGEWADDDRGIPALDLSFVKWGLADCNQRADWRTTLLQTASAQARPRVVFVAYSDWECADAPPVEEVVGLALSHPDSVLLIDTHCKDARLGGRRPTLLDWLPIPAIEEVCATCRDAGVRIALAGSLGLTEMQAILHVRPDWFAVRGAACGNSDREATIETSKVREIVELLRLR